MKKFEDTKLFKKAMKVNFLKKCYNIYESKKEMWLYLIFGGLTTLINILTYTFLQRAFNIDYMVSNIIAWIISVLFAFVTNKLYVFESKEIKREVLLKEFFSFILARILSLGIDMGIMYVGISILKINDIVIKILSNIVVIVVNYFLSKFLIFKKVEGK